MKPLILSTALLLGACATTPGIKVQTVETKVPVAVRCINASDVPPPPPKVGSSLTGNAQHDADILGASATRLRSWGETLMALIQPCTR